MSFVASKLVSSEPADEVRPALATIILLRSYRCDHTVKDNSGPAKSLPQQLSGKYSCALETDRTDHFRSCNILPKW